MSEDIVTRLRAVLHNDRSVELMNHEAADEIMQLRQQVEDLRGRLRGILEIQNEMVTHYVQERDDARRMVCRLDADTVEDQIEYAKQRGWNCFKENN